MNLSLERNEKFIMGRFECVLKTVSSSFYNGGFGERNGFFILQVDENFREDPYKISDEFEKSMEISNYVGFLTSVNLRKNAFYINDDDFFILLTLGLGYTCVPGKNCRKSRTINTIIVVKTGVKFNCAMDLLNVAISTKVYALMRAGKGVGTSSDAFMISFIENGGENYCGFATVLGKKLSVIFLKLMNDGINTWINHLKLHSHPDAFQ